jgi:hypothetical protein
MKESFKRLSEAVEGLREGIETRLAMKSPLKVAIPELVHKPVLETDPGLRKVLADIANYMCSN